MQRCSSILFEETIMKMGDTTSNPANRTTTLRTKFELEKRHHSKVVKNPPDIAASPSNHSQKRQMEEIVRHMSNLPCYLERGKPIQDRALNFGVMDWGRLEKWQYQQHKQGIVGNNKYSPSSCSSSLFFTTDGSSPYSCRTQNSHRVTSTETAPPFVKSGTQNLDKFQDFEDATNLLKSKPRGCKSKDLCPRDLHGSKPSEDVAICSSALKGKMKIEDQFVNKAETFQDPSCRMCDHDRFEIPRDASGNSRTSDEKSDTKHQSSSEDVHSDRNNDILSLFPVQAEVFDGKNSRNEANCKTPEEKKTSFPLKNSGFKTDSIAASNQRSISPLRRFSFSTSSKAVAPSKRAESPPVSRTSTKYNTSVSYRAHSSPLRRLLDPLFPSKTPPEDLKTKAKLKLDLKTCKDVIIDYSCTNKMNESASRKQALFQTAIKNGRPLFTFAVDKNCDILAATVNSLTGKDGGNGWIYTFFTVQEVKKKAAGWLSHGGKGKAHGFVPNVAAQMKVSNPSVFDPTIREFVLFSVDPSRLDRQVADIEQKDELAAIVVRFLEAGEEEYRDSFSTTVVLPGGHHGVPSKGEPSPLIERWRSGGACDCGGWDMGCRLRTLTNQVRSNSPEAHLATAAGQFELFFQGEVLNERPFSLSPLKDGIFSVEYNSSLSLLHAFSICISVMECRKSSQHSELRTYVAKQVDEDDEAPVTRASLLPLSPVERV